MKLRTKIMLTTTAVVVAMGILTMVLITRLVSSTLDRQLREKGITLVRLLAEGIANPLLDGQYLEVQRMLEGVKKAEEGVAYLYVTGLEGEVVAHTFPRGFPLELLEVNRVGAGSLHQDRFLRTERGLIWDVGLRVMDGLDAELHVGFTWEGVERAIGAIIKVLFSLTAGGVVLGGLAATGLSRLITRPLEVLAGEISRLGRGNLDDRIELESRDELGGLAACLNQMAEDLKRNISEVQRRNRELQALNESAAAFTGHSRLDQALDSALDQVLQVANAPAGWILLFEGEGKREVRVGSYQGILPGVVEREAREGFTRCGSLEKGWEGFVRVTELDPNLCILKTLDLEEGGTGQVCQASAPLLSKSGVEGVINILSTSGCFTPEILRFLEAMGRQVGVAVENVRLWEELRRRDEIRQQLLAKIMAAQEEERKRIARELHDETSQSLAALSMGLKVAADTVRSQPGKAAQLLEDLKVSTGLVVKELHRIMSDLRPSLLDDLGLIPAIRWYAETRLKAWGVGMSLEIEGEAKRLSSEVEIALFRIAQEAISNVVKYARASRVLIRLQFSSDSVGLEIEDDGCGFRPVEMMATGRGLGLLGMRERALLLGGEVTVSSEPGKGTLVAARLPVVLARGEVSG